MANRLVSNMYIIDSHQIARPLAYGTSDGVVNTTTSNVGKMKVMSIIFLANDTSANIKIAVGATNNIFLEYKFMSTNTNDAGLLHKSQVDHFGYGVPLAGVFIPTITASTAILVLE